MIKIKTLIVGNGGRESSIASKLAEDTNLYAVMNIENPTIKHSVLKSGGKYLIGDINNRQLIAEFAKANNIDLAFVSSDNPLEAGVIDCLLEAGINAVGPTRRGAEIEWNKIYSMELVSRVLPQYTPRYWILKSLDDIDDVFKEIGQSKLDVVVKPQGLTGGKGVKVMGPHLKDLGEAKEYARQILERKIGKSTSVLMVEKLDGIEYTIMAITDGKSIIFPPASYDHPYRYAGDTGPGTGGMGAFTDKVLPLPFMSEKHYQESAYIIQKTIEALREDKRHFNGVLNGGFFLTKEGIKFMEFNARFGDPECMNIMSILDTPLSSLLEDIYHQRLDPSKVKFKEKASVVKYLVAPEYALNSDGKPHIFAMNVDAITKQGASVYFASAVEKDGKDMFVTTGASRNVALAAVAESISEASALVDKCIDNYVKGPLEFRRDIGSQSQIELLTRYGRLLGM